MIDKKLTLESLKKKTLHDSFLTMLNASILWPEKWDAEEILVYWWEVAFPKTALTEKDLNDALIDNIRYALLKKGGIKKPTLIENQRTKLIKKSITFSEE